MQFNEQDRQHFEAAQGWLALRDWRSANYELEALSPQSRALPEVWRLRVEVYADAGKPLMALAVGQALVEWPKADAMLFVVLARCAVQVNRLEDARRYLEFALSRDTTQAFKLQLLEDDDLADVWGFGRDQPVEPP